MSLFEQLLGAINNPEQAASADQLGSLLGAVQQMAGGSGVDNSTTQAVMSMLGGYLRSSLQQQQASQGSDAVQMLVNQLSGASANPQAVSALFPPEMQQQISGAIGNQTGLDPSMIESMLPTLVPVALGFLQGGSPAQQSMGSAASASNPVLSAFLDSDRDGDVDMGDAMGMAMQFMQQR
jgi:hypothetical protein